MKRNLGMMAGLLVLAACGEKGSADAGKPLTAAPGQGAAIPTTTLAAGPSETPSGDCSGNRIGDPLILTLGKKSVKQLGGNDQQIDRNVSRGGTNLPDPPPLDGNILYPTNLDLQANTNGMTIGQKDYVEIQIRVESPDVGKRDLIFLRTSAGIVPATGDKPTAAVTVRVGDGGKFCFDGDIVKSGDIETVTLRSKLGPYEQSSINIGVQVANLKNNKFSTPIYIDPNVRNEG